MGSELADRETTAGRGNDLSPRLSRPGWRDPRLLLGVLIVVASVAGVVALVASQDRTVAVYAADRGLGVGQQVSAEELRVVHVRIDEVEEQYLSAENELPSDLQFVSVVEEGELVPLRALDEADPHGRQAVTLEVEDALARGVEPGRVVDLWAAHSGSIADEGDSLVELLVSAAEVSAITESSSTFGSQSNVTVELLVDPELLPDVLGARSSAATLSLVPAGATGGAVFDDVDTDEADSDDVDTDETDSDDAEENQG